MFRNSLSLTRPIRNRLTQRAWATSNVTCRFLGNQKDQPDFPVPEDFLQTFRAHITRLEKYPLTLSSPDRLSLLTALNEATEVVKKKSLAHQTRKVEYRRTDRPDDSRSAIAGMSEAIHGGTGFDSTTKPSDDIRFVKFTIQRDANGKADIVFQDQKITLVREGGAAHKAGMQPFTGWYIMEVDGNRVSSFVEIMEAFGNSIKPFGKFSLMLSRTAPALSKEHADRVDNIPEAMFTNIPSMSTSAADASEKLKEAERAQDQDQVDFWRGYLLVQHIENGDEGINTDS